MKIAVYIIGIKFILARQAFSFVLRNTISHQERQNGQHRQHRQHRHLIINPTNNVGKEEKTKMNLSPSSIISNSEQLQLQQLTIWITAFSSLHIGMSAIRDTLIQSCGQWAENANLVNRKIVTLPTWWPGDDVGGDEIFPNTDTAGRQIYRLGYTIVSFFTLGGALSTYLSIVQAGGDGSGVDMGVMANNSILTDQEYRMYFSIASASFAASIASLFNASPLSLMPGFQKVEEGKGGDDKSGMFSNNEIIKSASSGTIGGMMQRNDGLKFEPKGLTRITRHPLILPVIPWGFATSILLGGQSADFILFGGLSIYAVAGCACQDLRVSRKEGSVGTVFNPLSSDKVGNQLDDFFSMTSFVPFAAVVDGRQPIGLLVKEIPYLPLIIGFSIGGIIEENLLQLLHV